MVKSSVCALALSLLMPALTLAFVTQRDFINAGYGVADAMVQENISELLSNKETKWGWSAKIPAGSVLKGYLNKHAFRATGFGEFHEQVGGPYLLKQFSQKPVVTDRDKVSRALGQVAFGYLTEQDHTTSKPLLFVNPLIVWTLAKWAYKNSPSLQADVQSAEQAAENVYNDITSSSDASASAASSAAPSKPCAALNSK